MTPEQPERAAPATGPADRTDAPLVFDGAELGDAFVQAVPELGVPWQAVSPATPSLVVLNEPLASRLGFDPDALRTETGVRFLLGNALAPGSRPVAQAYAGHQFGGYSPRLGDGRALLLGDLTAPDGAVYELHLKGSGRTPFARADGFAAVGPMLREYLVGEFMHAVGIPTSRALAVVSTGRWVPRDELLPGAVLTRVASSHLRVGTFQLVRSTGDAGLLRRLADHAIARHYPSLAREEAPYLGLLERVIDAQARLVAAWMGVGFVHGVMNTDNVTVSGETIDYGPCAFIDTFDPAAVFSSIDHQGRYAYGNQPQITLWNLTRFAESLLPLLDDDDATAQRLALDALGAFQPHYDSAWARVMRGKLGLNAVPGEAEPESGPAPGDEAIATLANEMLVSLQAARVDFTQFFRALGEAAQGDDGPLRELSADADSWRDWLERWRRLGPDPAAMRRANPVYIPRNHLMEQALDAANDGDFELFGRMAEVLAAPFDVRPGLERYAMPPPAGSRPTVTTCGT